MKNIYILLFAASVLSFASCSDFLEERPETTLTSVAVFGDDESAWSAMVGCYAIVCSYDYYGQIFWEAHNLNSTEYTSAINNGNYPTQLARFTTNPSLGTYSQIYKLSYKAINAINLVLGQMPDAPLSDNVKREIYGNCYILRAMLYFNLVREFGGVPLILKSVTTLEEAHSPRTDAATVYERIISDLGQAWEYLPEAGANRAGFPHKWAAKALLSKVYMTMTAGEENSPYWKLAYDTAKEVYGAHVYSLVRPFSALWDPAKENSSESIIEFQLSENTEGRLMSVNMPQDLNLIPNVTFNNNNARIRLTQEMYDDFVAKYPGDPRIDVSILHTSILRKLQNGGSEEVLVYPSAGSLWSVFPFCRKYIDVNSVGVKGANNFIYMRYADLLLILAECANELGYSDATDYVNEVLDRARDADGNGSFSSTEIQPAAWQPMSKEDFRKAIMMERRFELLGECHSWFDERRRGDEWLLECFRHHNENPAITTYSGKPGVLAYPTDAENVHKLMLWPIPTDEITNNKAIEQSDQNPGW